MREPHIYIPFNPNTIRFALSVGWTEDTPNLNIICALDYIEKTKNFLQEPYKIKFNNLVDEISHTCKVLKILMFAFFY